MDVEIVSVLAGVSTVCYLIHSVRSVFTNRSRKSDEILLTELRDLRAEMQAMRQENHSLILALDDERVPASLKHSVSQAESVEILVSAGLR